MIYLARTFVSNSITLNQILKLIGFDTIGQLHWLVHDIEVSEALYPEFWELWNKRSNTGIFISGDMFIKLSVHAHQVIEGEFVGFNKDNPPEAWQLSNFNDRDAIIFIEFIDGYEINVFFKDERIRNLFGTSDNFTVEDVPNFPL